MEEIILKSDMDVDLVQHNATDESVAWSARVSTLGEMAEKSEQPIDGLINFLLKNRHGTPFEHNSFTFRISAPIFVFREFMRHRVGFSYNEESARYRELQPVFYLPSSDRPLVQQGKTGHYYFTEGTRGQYEITIESMADAYHVAYDNYKKMIEAGIAKEVARSVLPVGTYSTMFATCNARSLMSFLSLRTSREKTAFPSYPQKEIEMVAEQMEKYLAMYMPITFTSFNENGRVAP